MELTFLLYLPGPDTGSTETAKTNVANAPVWRKPIRQTHTHTRSLHIRTHICNLHATEWYAYQTAFVDSGCGASGSRKRAPQKPNEPRMVYMCVRVYSCLLYKNIFVRLNYHQNVECYRRRQCFCSASHRDDSLGSFLLVLSGEWCRRRRLRRCRSHLTERFGWTQNFHSDMHFASYAKRSLPFVIFSPLLSQRLLWLSITRNVSHSAVSYQQYHHSCQPIYSALKVNFL